MGERKKMKKVLVTGAKGFIGKNLVLELKNRKTFEIFECDVDTTEDQLAQFAKECEFVFHLAGVNRPQRTEEFMEGNYGFTTKLLEILQKNENRSPILMSSSIQAKLDNDYGKSKKAGEDYILDYGSNNSIATYVFRLPNVYGKWCRPNYNSAIATFCNNIARGLEIKVNDRSTLLTVVYIDDVVNAFIDAADGIVERDDDGYCKVPVEDKITLGEIVDTLYSFKDSRKTLSVANMNRGVIKKLYSTYLSYLPEDEFAYDLRMNADARGSFTEFLRTDGQGQVSINISKPHIVKGNHWHHTKNEKFLVVKGTGVIRFRKIGTDKVIEYPVSGDKLQVVDIPCGYTHNIENVGDDDMVTVMWANEPFDKDHPDTFYEEVWYGKDESDDNTRYQTGDHKALRMYQGVRQILRSYSRAYRAKLGLYAQRSFF